MTTPIAARAARNCCRRVRTRASGSTASARPSPVQLRAAYLMGEAEPLKLLLNQRDPLQSGRLLAYYGYFVARSRGTDRSTIAGACARLTQLDTAAGQQQRQLATAQKPHSRPQLQQLEHARDERQQVLASLTAASRTREQSLARLKSQQADLERLLEQLNALAARRLAPPDTTSAFGRLRGHAAWPVSGRITAAFGEQRAGGCALGRNGGGDRARRPGSGGVRGASGVRRLAAGAGAAA